MRAVSLTMGMAALAVALALALLWGLGALEPLAAGATAQQKAVQNALAGTLRALRAGQPGAWAGLLAVCFAYGFLHAVGPGHGKALIGGYGMARRVRLVPLLGLTLVSALAQSLVAVLLVAAGAFALGWTRETMEGVAETTMTPVSHALVAGLGVWLVWRGARGLLRQAPLAAADHAHDHHHDHHHHHDADCGCGHAHGPTPAQVAEVTSWRDAALLVAAVALRPCSGALFLLVLTFAMGIGRAGVVGSFAMGLGTAAFTMLIAVLAFYAREGALAALPGAGLARFLPGVEMVAGAGLAALSLMLLAQSV